MTLEVSGADYLLPAGQTLTFVEEDGIRYWSYQTPISLTISGTVQLTFAPYSGLQSSAGGFSAITAGLFAYPGAQGLLITPSGSVKVDLTGSAHLRAGAGGVQVSYGPAFVNQGLIEVKGYETAHGVYVVEEGINNPIPTLNAGRISVTSINGVATGLTTSGPSSHPVNTGLIEVFSGAAARDTFSGASAVGWAIGGKFGQNDGQIIAHALTGDAKAFAVTIVGWRAYTTTFTNTGLLQGDVALQSYGDSSQPSEGPTLFIQNSGTMIGEVNLANVAHLLTNSGSIIGATTFGSANDFYDGRAGSETGLLSGGGGADTLLGGGRFDYLQGNQGADSISGGGGDDMVVGGKDNDVQSGDDGDDIVWGNLGDDTLDGGNGADQVRGGQGDDVVNGGDGDDYVSGDRGNDTITGGAGADLFHTFGDAGIDKVLDFSTAQGDRVLLDPGTQSTVAQVGADVVISMTGGGQMTLVGVTLASLPTGWIFET